jgi:hypothetical protein
MKGNLESVAEENTNSVVFIHSVGLHAQELRQKNNFTFIYYCVLILHFVKNIIAGIISY